MTNTFIYITLWIAGILAACVALYVVAMGIGRISAKMRANGVSELKVHAFTFAVWIPIIALAIIIRNFG